MTFVYASLSASVALQGRTARAQATLPSDTNQAAPETAADGAQKIVPPRLLSPTAADYPRGAQGSHTVVLAVTVNADGSVRALRLLEGGRPFASAATEAAKTWRFKPAEKGGRAIAAIVRVQVRFIPPIPVAPTESPAEVRAAPAVSESSVTPTGQTMEVIVQGERSTLPASSTLARAEARQLPGAFGDPFRALEVLPGVTPIISGLPYFYVRGSPPANVGYFVDGVRIPYLYHFALAPSIMNPALIERVDLYPGGYPAQFGRYTGAIVAVETTEPRPQVSGEGTVRLIDAGGLLEAPLAQGRVHALVGGRYSYTAALFSLFAPDVSVDYRDYQLRLGYQLSPDDRLSLFGFGAYDLAASIEDGKREVLFATEFYRADLRYDRQLGPRSNLRIATTVGLDRTRISGKRFAMNRSAGGRIELTTELSSELLLRAGTDLLVEVYSTDPPNPYGIDVDELEFQTRFFSARTDLATGTRFDVVARLTRAVELTAGLRADLFGSGGVTALSADPRLSGRALLSQKTRVFFASGVAHQPPAFPIPLPAVSIDKLRGGLQRAFHSSAGVETDLPEAITLTTEIFHNTFQNMNDAFGVGGLNSIEDAAHIEERSDGYAFGAELSLKRRLTRHLGGLISYTLSRSVRSVDGKTLPSSYDRTHVLNTALMLDLGRRWRLGSRGLLYTGGPRIDTIQNLSSQDEFVTRTERLPTFFRLDLRAEKRWHIGKGWISLVLEALNVTLSREVVGYECSDDGCRPNEFPPLALPMLGVEGGF